MLRGDAGAFEVLYCRHRDWVLRLALRFCRHEADALDVTQEAFCHLASRPPSFRLTGKLTTYLYPVVKHFALAAVAKRGRNTATPVDMDAFAARPAEFRSDDLQIAVNRLPEAQREVLLMRFVDDLSLAEIAEALSIPLGTVKSRLHHAIQTLRDDPATKNYFFDD